MTPEDPPPGLAELGTLVRDCAVSGVGRHVLLLRADLLAPHLANPQHLRLAQDALDSLLGADRARRHLLAHGRQAVSWRGEAPARLGHALASLGHLLQEAPPDTPPVATLTRLFHLPEDGVALLALASSPTSGAPAPPRPGEHAGRAQAARPIDLATLQSVETSLAHASVARFARRRPVCRIARDALLPAWENRFLSIHELAAELCPGHAPAADPWLFRRLTRTLDRRMLALLSTQSELRDAGPFALDLNVRGLLSPEFLRFDAVLPPRLRGHTVIGLHPADIMADIPAYRFAAAFARQRGHRLLLRGLTAALLPLLDIEAIGPDLTELVWSPAVAGLTPSTLPGGPATWVLSRADDSGLRWARAAGFGLVQGDTIRARH